MDESLGDISLLRMHDGLRDAAVQGNIDALYAWIERDPKVLDRINNIPFVDTPLHIAASAGHIGFAMEVMKLKPSFAKKLNQDGFTPLHLALQKQYELENDPVLRKNRTLLVNRLLDVDKNIIRVQGRGGVTPLHYVAELGNIYFLTKFFKICPESFEDATNRRENVLHIALKHDMVDAFRLLLQWIQRASFKDASLWEEKLLFWQDEKGNTLLHVAVSKNLPKVVSWLMDTGLVDLEAKNLDGHTVFDILENQTLTEGDRQRMRENLQHGCATRFRARVTLFVTALELAGHRVCEKLFVRIRRQETGMTDNRRNALLVVAVLLLTVTYQAGLNPPMGDWKPNNTTAPSPPTNAKQDPLHRMFNSTTAQLRAFSDWINKNSLNGNAFLLGNTITYYLTNFTLFFLLPPDFIGLVLFLLLVLLSFCYCVSTPLLNAPFIYTIGVVFTGLFLYFCLLVFPGRRVKHVSSFVLD